jgi:hypothetical protein
MALRDLAAEPVPHAAEPCRDCPWRTENRGRRSKGGWYSLSNLRRLWSGMRRGERMSCHPTDPRMAEIADQAYEGFKPAPPDAKGKECVGAMVLVRRELGICVGTYGSDIGSYRRARPRGLTKHGLAAALEREVFEVLSDVNPNHPDVSHPDLGDDLMPEGAFRR